VTSAEASANTLEWKGRTGPFTINVNEGVFNPTTTSRTLADALEINEGDTVIDVGCGSGVLSFVAARLGAGRVIGCDLSEEAIIAARQNAIALGLQDRTEFRVGSLFDPVRDVSANVIIGDVSGVPDEIGKLAGWFPDGHAGGPTGAELPSLMVESVGDCLAPGGRMYLPTGTIQNESKVLEVARKVFGAANMEKVVERTLPLPDLVAKSKAAAAMISEGFFELQKRGSRWLWQLRIWRCVRGDS
jgi:protein-L-isoaspartate O-methyltransferase